MQHTGPMQHTDRMRLTCPTRSRVWRDGVLVAGDLSFEQVHELVREPGTMMWIDVQDPDQADIDELQRYLSLTSDVIEDLVAPYERPKVTRHGELLFFVTYGTALLARNPGSSDHGRLGLNRVAGFVTHKGLVTVRHGDGFDIDELESRWSANSDLLMFGVGALLHGLLDLVVDSQFDTIQQLDDNLESLEDELFDDRGAPRSFVRQVYGTRKDLVRLRRVVLPMREVVNALLRHRIAQDNELSRWYDDLYDHVLRAAEWTESLRDMVTSVFETNLSLQDNRLNTIMKRLSGWAAIIAIPTAVTGWFGQNVPYPGFAKPLGLWLSVGLIAVLSVSLYVMFKRRDWL